MKAIHHFFANIPNSLVTLGDQCIVSGANFSVSILLVSFLGMELYGIFSVLWMIVLLVSGIQQSLIIMPLFALLPKSENKLAYLGRVYRLQICFSCVSAVVTCMALSCIRPWFDLSYSTILLSGIVVGVFSFQDFLRRVFFVVGKPLQSAIIDVIGYGSLPLLIVVMHLCALLHLNSLLCVIAATKLVSILLGVYFVRAETSYSGGVRNAWKQHWVYAKYLFASSILQWCSGNIFILFSATLIGPTAIAALRVAQNTLGLLNVFFLFLENSVPIHAAHILHSEGNSSFTSYIHSVVKKYLPILLCLLLGIYAFQDQILAILYGSAMHSYEWLIPAFCVLYVFIFLGTIFRFVFRTIEKNEILLSGYVVSAVIGLSCAYPLIQNMGLIGVVLGLFLTQITSLITYFIHYKLIA